MKRIAFAAFLLLIFRGGSAPSAELRPVVHRTLDVAPVWAGHPVRFALLTHGDRQFVAYFDAERRMTVAARRLNEREWQYAVLPSRVGWDSHNYITMAVDANEHLHVSGNMHCVPLIYFRTKRPLDVGTLRQVESLVERNEDRCTYPRFLRGARDEFIFTYRDGGSGNGDQIFNVYDPSNNRWRRLLDAPLFSGEGKMNAYFVGPVQDAAGVFHVCWVWRDTPDCATNHHLCYAQSRDLVHWQRSDAAPLALPITLATAECVDPVPPGGGMINGNTKIGFDAQGRVVIAYHKFDAAGHTQLFNARREADGWRIYQTSDWDTRWEFHGGGTIPFEIRIGPIETTPDGVLTQSARHAKHGAQHWRLDPQTLKPVGRAPRREGLPAEIGRLRSDRPGMGVRTVHDLGASGDPNTRFVLRWETMPVNRDRPHTGEHPPPSMLQVVEVRTKGEGQSLQQ